MRVELLSRKEERERDKKEAERETNAWHAPNLQRDAPELSSVVCPLAARGEEVGRLQGCYEDTSSISPLLTVCR